MSKNAFDTPEKTKKKEEKKTPPRAGIFWGIIGGILALAGIALLAYSIFVQYNKSSSQEISELLPAQNLQFFLTSTHAQNTNSQPSQEFTFLSAVFPELLPENGVLAAYQKTTEDDSVFIRVEPKREQTDAEKKSETSSAPKNLYCEENNSYWFCTLPDHKNSVIEITDTITNQKENNEHYVSVAEKAEFIAAQKFLAEYHSESGDPAAFQFFGTTPFFTQTLWEHTQFLLPNQTKESAFTIMEFGAKYSPYTAGKISDGDFVMAFQKSSEEFFFGKEVAKYNFSPRFLPPQTDRYLLMKKPEIFWNTFFPLFEHEQLDTSFVTQASLEKYFSSTLLSKNTQLSFEKDVFPLFSGDVLWANSQESSAVIYSLPKKSISEKVFETFSKSINGIAKSSVPIKIGHTLKDGTTIYEVFSNEKNLRQKNESDENGNKVLFQNTNPETQKTYTVGVITRDTFLMLSDGENFLDHFWDLSKEGAGFIFPQSDQHIFSFGYKKRDIEISPVLFANILGEETQQHFLLSGRINWNTDFMSAGKETSESENKNQEESENSEETVGSEEGEENEKKTEEETQ